VAIVNALQFEAALATPALFRFNYDAMPSLEVAELVHCHIIAFLLLIHYFTPWPWPLTLWPWPLTFDTEHLQCVACDVMKLSTKFERNRAIRGGVYCDFSIWPNDLERCVTCCARLWDDFHDIWPSATYPYL